MSTDTNSCFALLVIDNEPIRRQLESVLQTIRAAIEGCEEEIARHEKLDLPAFRQWMAVRCTDLLNERQLVEEKIWALRARLAAIQGLKQHGIRNLAAAFFWFQEIENDRASIPPYVRRAWEEVTVGDQGKRPRGVEAGRFDEGRDDKDADDDPFGEWSDGAGGGFSDGCFDGTKPKAGEHGEIARHKSLYRKIALLLHPDLAGVLSKQKLELWYQAQRAYKDEDVVGLETILARCDGVGTNNMTLSELRGLVRQANSRLTTLQQSIVIMATAVSWRFLLLSPFEVEFRSRDVRRELESTNRGLMRERSILENELARIEAWADRWMKKRKEEQKQLVLRF